MMNNESIKFDLAGSVKVLKTAILQAQHTVASDANRVMLMLYLGIGRFISQKTRNGAWGTGAVQAIAEQLQKEMPGLRGFSGTNLKKMRQFYETWEDCLIRPPAAVELLSYSMPESSANRPPVAVDFEEGVGVLFNWALPVCKKGVSQEDFFNISFTHHLEILNYTQTLKERLFYIHKSAVNRWSKLMLRAQLKADAYHHTGTIPSNFTTTMPSVRQAMKALSVFKDEYLLDFINTEELDATNPEDVDEPVIEHAIVANIKRFIMTFGQDFSFIGNQYRLDVMGHEQFIDLLFFNRELNCLVALELKKGAFKSAYLGQLNLYLQALDDQIRKPHENSSIGIILCKEADKLYVEYAVRDYNKPMGVATYRTAEEMPEKWRKVLPSIDALQAQLNTFENEGE